MYILMAPIYFEYTSLGVYTGFNFGTSTQFASLVASLDFDGTTFTDLRIIKPIQTCIPTPQQVFTQDLPLIHSSGKWG